MSIFTGELGLQFVTHLANHYTVPDLVRLAQFAADKGFKHIWVNDNIRYRGQLVVLTAIAARVPIKLGTAIMVPYFHNPLDVADCLATLAELCEGREIGVGMRWSAKRRASFEARSAEKKSFIGITRSCRSFIVSIRVENSASRSSPKQHSSSTAAATARSRCACAAA